MSAPRREHDWDVIYKLVIIGDPAVGKSSILLQFAVRGGGGARRARDRDNDRGFALPSVLGVSRPTCAWGCTPFVCWTGLGGRGRREGPRIPPCPRFRIRPFGRIPLSAAARGL